jgi:acyl-CoA thioesterase-1
VIKVNGISTVGLVKVAGAVALMCVLAAASGCRRGDGDSVAAGGSAGSAPPPPAASAASPPRADRAAHASRPRIVVLGDSIAAGLGLPIEEAFPARLQEKVNAQGLDYEVVAAGVSGDTSAGGLRRLDWALDGDVRVLVLELGANDGLRGLPVTEMRRNLAGIITRAKARGVRVVLCGMEAPPNFGAAYTSEFRGAFRSLARDEQVPFVPFLLEGVAGLADMNQADGIHPNTAGARRVADTVWAALGPVVSGS